MTCGRGPWHSFQRVEELSQETMQAIYKHPQPQMVANIHTHTKNGHISSQESEEHDKMSILPLYILCYRKTM